MNKVQRDLFTLACDHEGAFRARIVAAITYKNKVIAYGFNQQKTHPFQERFKKNPLAHYIHAETDAIKNALKRITTNELAQCTLYVIRVKNQGKNLVLGMSKPCNGCMACLNMFPVKKIIFSNESNEFSEMNYDKNTNSYL